MKRFAIVFLILIVLVLPAFLFGLRVGRDTIRSPAPATLPATAEADLRKQIALLTHNLESHRHRRATEDRYNIRISGAAAPFTEGDRSWDLHGDPVTAQQVLDVLPIVLNGIDRYPVAAIKSAGLHRILLSGSIWLQGKPEGGLADHASGTMYLYIPSWDAADPVTLRSFHHELYHLIDQTVLPSGDPDPEWSALNTKGFTYGTGGGLAAAGDMLSTVISDRWPGFITPYCRAAAEEDKAETFSCMMVFPEAVAARIKTDPVVAAKVALIRKRFAVFCPGFAI